MNKKIVMAISVLMSGVIIIGAVWHFFPHLITAPSPIKIGLLHSQTGPLAENEKNVLDMELLVIDEINKAGGVLGRKLLPIVADGKSDEFEFADQAERLITKEKVVFIIGCWSSASRKAVKTVVEKHDNLLLYPTQYEGVEESKNIFYMGATPNQQIIPAVTWCFNTLGKKFFLIGSDYIFPHVAHKILKLHIASLGGQVVGEEFIKLGGIVTPAIIKKIVQSGAEVICNSINGQTNISFFKELFAAGITSEKIPTMSFSVGEPDIPLLERSSIISAYCAVNYFQQINVDVNNEFVKRFQARYGKNRSVGDAMQSVYSLLHMWRQAVEDVHSLDIQKVIASLKKQVHVGPSGIIYFDENQNIWQTASIGKVNFEGQLIPVWDSATQIRPEPFPPYLSKKEWESFINALYEGWGKRWSAV